MSRRDNATNRCERCRMHASLCICALIPRLETRTRLVLVIHRREERKPTNTGRLATLALPNSEMRLRGHEGERHDTISFDPRTRPLLLFPHEGAVPLDTLAHPPGDDRPVTLVVPDGNWRQASKVRQRVQGLADVPCVTLPLGDPSAYRLRSEAHAFGLATVEAIARALRHLEGERGEAIERELLGLFDAMVGRTLWTRGTFAGDDVAGGIPEGAVRHDPRSRAT